MVINCLRHDNLVVSGLWNAWLSACHDSGNPHAVSTELVTSLNKGYLITFCFLAIFGFRTPHQG